MNTKCYWVIILILSLENNYQMAPRRQQDSLKDNNNMLLGKSEVEHSLEFENSQSLSNSDTQELSLSSSTKKTTILLEIINS